MTGRRRLALGVAAALCAVAGTGAVAVGLFTDRSAPPAATTFGSFSSQASPTPTTTPTPSNEPTQDSTAGKKHRKEEQSATDSEPTKINIPTIGVQSEFVPLDLMANGELSTPSDPDRVGWFTGAYTPGGPGVAVIAGHVTWNGAEAAFFDLGELEQDDRLKINRENGSTAVFSVRRMATFAKDEFPTEQVYRHSKQPKLVLITCGGDYSADRHHYSDNVIVWADLVETID